MGSCVFRDTSGRLVVMGRFTNRVKWFLPRRMGLAVRSLR